jgi:hypothetical protein
MFLGIIAWVSARQTPLSLKSILSILLLGRARLCINRPWISTSGPKKMQPNFWTLSSGFYPMARWRQTESQVCGGACGTGAAVLVGSDCELRV